MANYPGVISLTITGSSYEIRCILTHAARMKLELYFLDSDILISVMFLLVFGARIFVWY